MKRIDGYDIIVAGGGPGGFAAAVAAGRAGAKVLLLERAGCLGGAATTMLVSPFMSHLTSPDEQGRSKVVNAGIFREVTERLAARGAADISGRYIRFDDEAMKLVLDEFAAEAGVDVIFHAALFDAATAGGRVTTARFAHNSGPIVAAGAVFIDGTGDALLAASAGCRCEFGDRDGNVMPMTLNFIVGGIDQEKFPAAEIRKLAAAGGRDDPPLVNTNVSCVTSPRAGYMQFNAIRTPGNTLDPGQVSRCEIDGRRRVENFVAWLRVNVPGCEGCYLVKTGAHVGVRESRRVMGRYLLSYDDFRNARTFDDGVACCSYGIDIHGQGQGQTRIEHLGPGRYYQIPYRCLTPIGPENLLVAGRGISADVEVHSSLRIMPTVMCIGQAAGIAAAMSLPSGKVADIDVQQLRRRIRDAGGALDPLDPLDQIGALDPLDQIDQIDQIGADEAHPRQNTTAGGERERK